MSAAAPARAVAPAVTELEATVTVPGSKSIANRALICAALTEGCSTVRGVPDGDDTSALTTALSALGVGVHTAADGTLEIAGGRTRWRSGDVALQARLAGTTARFLTALAALRDEPTSIDGEPPLRARPMGALHSALAALGATVTAHGGRGRLPVVVRGPLHGGRVELPGDVSSQFLSALMMIAPLVEGGVEMHLLTPLVSRPYVTMTAGVMAEFGHDDVVVADDVIRVGPGAYRPTELRVEPDASSASYPLAAAAIRGGSVRVRDLAAVRLQGDRAIVDLLVAMGCQATLDGDDIVLRSTGRLHGIDVDMADVSDLVPTIAAVACTARTPTTIRGVGFIRGKESDRLGDLAVELGRLGAEIIVTGDGLRIEAPRALHGARLDPHHDHRLAMIAGVLGLVVDGVRVGDPGCVSKSWPGFWAMLDSLAAPPHRLGDQVAR